MAGHHHNIAVALQAGHLGRIAERRAEDLRTIVVGLVVVRRIVEQLCGASVEVIVNNVGHDTFDRRGGDELQAGILGLDCLVELCMRLS